MILVAQHKKNYFFCTIWVLVSSLFLYYIASPLEYAHFDLDSFGYDRIAKHFCTDNRLLDPTQPGIMPVQTLGYPLFLGIIYKLFKYDYMFIIIAQVILNVLLGLCIYRIAYHLFSASTAVIALYLWAINLGYLVFSQFIMTDMLLATILALGLERIILFLKTRNGRYSVHAALIFGISVIIKPVALLYVFIVLIYIILASDTYTHALRRSGLFLILFSLPVVAYMYHNKRVFNNFSVAPVMYENIHYYFLSRARARIERISYTQAFEKTGALLHERDKNHPDHWRATGLLLQEYSYTKPFDLVYVWMQNVLKTLAGFYTSQLKYLVNPTIKGTDTSFFQQEGTLPQRLYSYVLQGLEGRCIQAIALLYCVAFILQIALVCAGLCILATQKEYMILSFLLLTILYFAFITGHEGCARYRLMFESLYIVLVAYALDVCSKKHFFPALIR
jgi:4-amino-4-deoxy-L-arabinose transferase-like glycosyltransferase